MSPRRSSRHRAAVRRRRIAVGTFVGVAALAALIGLCLAWFVPAVQVTYLENEARSA